MKEEKEIKKKTAEQRAKDHEADNLLSYIIASTFARHAKMSEEEFLKDIGFEDSGKTEDEAIRISIFNVLVEATKELLMSKQSFKTTSELIKLCLNDEEIVENEVKGE